MQFNVSTLLREPTGSIREYDIDDASGLHWEGPDR